MGLGSPYPPQQVGVEIFAEASGGDPGVWGNATITPGTGQPASISQISWNTRDDITLAPAENEEVSLETIFDGGSLVVYYVSSNLLSLTGVKAREYLTDALFASSAVSQRLAGPLHRSCRKLQLQSGPGGFAVPHTCQ